MKVIIQTPDFKATPQLQEFADSRVQKLTTFYNNIVEARVCLKLDHSENKENKICELQVVIPGNDLFASKRAGTFEESVTLAVEAIRHQAEKRKTNYERQRAV